MSSLNADTYLLAKACNSAVFVSLMNAMRVQDNEQECRRWERQADKLESKFKTQFGYHPQTYIDLYEQSNKA